MKLQKSQLILNKKQFLVALPLMIILGFFIYYVPVHNILELQKHQYDCKSNASFLQLENGTIIPCQNHPLSLTISDKK